MDNKFLYGFFATILVFVVGFFGLLATFSDLGPGETWVNRITTVFAVSLIGSVGVGFFLNKWWPVAIAVSWGFLLGGKFLSQWPDSLFPVAMLIVPILCLLGGFAGYRLRKHYIERKQARG